MGSLSVSDVCGLFIVSGLMLSFPVSYTATSAVRGTIVITLSPCSL